MTFPIKYVGEVVLNKAQGFNLEQYQNILAQQFPSDKEVFSEKQFYAFPLPLVGLKLRFKIEVQEDHATVQVSYTISLFELNLILLLLGALSFIFSLSSNFAVSSFFLLLGLGYYWYGISTISHKIKSIIAQKMEASHFMEEPGLWKLQQQWMRNEHLCSACGETINPYAQFCVNCGIKVDRTPKQRVGNSSPSLESDTINYTYRKDS